MAAISSIRNLGPAMETAFTQVGITTAEELREMGPDAAYGRLLQHGHRPHFIGYYVLVMGLQGRPWNDCKGKEKEALRKRFDRLKANFKTNTGSDLWSQLREIGILNAGPD